MKFEFVTARKFFDLLYNDTEFCGGLGKVMLTAGMLETNLRRYMMARKIKGVGARTTLGRMVDLLKEHRLLTHNGEMHFGDLALKRNYLAHSLYDLFSEEIEETILPRTKLVEMDVEMFSEKVNSLAQDFLHFSRIVSKADPSGEHLL
jgi:hypothetical protein